MSKKKVEDAALKGIAWIEHGFFTRDGAPDDLVTLHQIHSGTAVAVKTPWAPEAQPQADALVTDQPNIKLAVKTADCVPVLFACTKKEIIGAAHAGWKGALNGVLESTVEEMEKLGARREDIVASIGPCIRAQSYEVSQGFEKPFLEQDSVNAAFFKAAAKPGHLMFDLPGYVEHRLKKMGLSGVTDTGRDTLSDEETFFSYRRSTLRGEKDYGRQMSVIAIKR